MCIRDRSYHWTGTKRVQVLVISLLLFSLILALWGVIAWHNAVLRIQHYLRELSDKKLGPRGIMALYMMSAEKIRFTIRVGQFIVPENNSREREFNLSINSSSQKKVSVSSMWETFMMVCSITSCSQEDDRSVAQSRICPSELC
eukprot:TRINITY_DN17450_c0_g1_i1.p1 TRINITY_DN17450_c0_g1~~TRINITY_DN17450_c0_g1_i1.p1  ORF type:complete len:163 (+),score=14.65 TRINITY_DN17450_c0_g1_i1:60-491(+)